jgi:hypothetical protein
MGCKLGAADLWINKAKRSRSDRTMFVLDAWDTGVVMNPKVMSQQSRAAVLSESKGLPASEFRFQLAQIQATDLLEIVDYRITRQPPRIFFYQHLCTKDR